MKFRSVYLLDQRFTASFLKFALLREVEGEEKGGNANLKTKHTEPLTQETP